jgi:hypothetical protein
MPGPHHRKPTNTAIRLARTGALTVMATAPLAVITGSALAASGADALTRAEHHEGGRWDDRNSDDRNSDDRNSDDRNSDDRDDADAGSDSDDRDDHGDDADGDGHGHGAGWSDDGDDAPSGSDADSSGSTSAGDARWNRMAQCESGENWDADTGNGYKGGLQFSDSTWRNYGGRQYAPSADQASREEQIAVAKKVERHHGWQAWPSCSHQMGHA